MLSTKKREYENEGGDHLKPRLIHKTKGLTSYLLVESGRERAHAHVGFSCSLVDVLQAVSVSVHDQTGVVVKQNANAVVTQLIS